MREQTLPEVVAGRIDPPEPNVLTGGVRQRVHPLATIGGVCVRMHSHWLKS